MPHRLNPQCVVRALDRVSAHVQQQKGISHRPRAARCMTPKPPSESPTPSESASSSPHGLSVVRLGAFAMDASRLANCQDAKCQEQPGTCHAASVDNARMARKPSVPVDTEGISRELRRFQLLIRLLRDVANVNRAEMARRTGIDETHLSKLVNTEKYGYTGLSA